MLKLRGRTTKHIFKRAVQRLLPAEVIHRAKQCFGVPISRWFRRELREMAYETLLSRLCLDRGLFRRGYIQWLLDEHVEGKTTWHPQLWCLLFLKLSFQRFTDERLSP